MLLFTQHSAAITALSSTSWATTVGGMGDGAGKGHLEMATVTIQINRTINFLFLFLSFDNALALTLLLRPPLLTHASSPYANLYL